MDTILDHAQWHPVPVQLHDLKDERLPLVVRLTDPDRELSPGVDTKAAFLIYSRRRRTKVYAECLVEERGKKEAMAYGPVYEIPKDYTGWFEVHPPTGTPPQPDPSLENLVRCKQILVRSTLHVFPYDDNDIDLDHELKIYPGEVLTVREVIKKQWKVKQSSSSASSSSASLPPPSTSFVRCIDFSQRDICVPISHPGSFNPICDPELSSTSSNPDNAVYQIADLVGRQLPVVVKMAFGWPPQDGAGGSEVPFTGVLRLVGLRRPDTMVLCNIVTGRTLLMEIPVDIDLPLYRADNLDVLQQDPAYTSLLKKCYAKVYQFVISIRAMALKYPLLEPENGRTHMRCSVALDMDRFNPLDVFPQLEEDEQPGQSFQLSFIDPDDHRRAPIPVENGVDEALVDSPELLGGPRTTEAVRSNLHYMRQQSNRQREGRESLA